MKKRIAMTLAALLLTGCVGCRSTATESVPVSKPSPVTKSGIVGSWAGSVELNAELLIHAQEYAVPTPNGWMRLSAEEKTIIRDVVKEIGAFQARSRLTIAETGSYSLQPVGGDDLPAQLRTWESALIQRCDAALLPMRLQKLCAERGIRETDYLRFLGYDSLAAFQEARSAWTERCLVDDCFGLTGFVRKDCAYEVRDRQLLCYSRGQNENAVQSLGSDAAYFTLELRDGILSVLSMENTLDEDRIFSVPSANSLADYALQRDWLFRQEDLWNKKTENDRRVYAYEVLQRSGHLCYVNYADFLRRTYLAKYGAGCEAREDYRADLTCLRDPETYRSNASVQAFLRQAEALGFEVRYLEPATYQNGRAKPGGTARLIAVDETVLGFPRPAIPWLIPQSYSREA